MTYALEFRIGKIGRWHKSSAAGHKTRAEARAHAKELTDNSSTYRVARNEPTRKAKRKLSFYVQYNHKTVGKGAVYVRFTNRNDARKELARFKRSAALAEQGYTYNIVEVPHDA